MSFLFPCTASLTYARFRHTRKILCILTKTVCGYVRYTLLDANPVLGDLLPDVKVQPVHETQGQEDAGHEDERTAGADTGEPLPPAPALGAYLGLLKF